jgi:short-chain fatty acids transporter
MFSISRLGLRISEIFRRIAPDPFIIAVLLTLLTAILALALGFQPLPATPALSLADKTQRLIDAWGTGIWDLLRFGMQMCLVLITGHAVAASPPMRRIIGLAAARPTTPAGAAALIAFMACFFGIINWGLGLIIGAIMAREVGRSLSARGIRAHYPLLAAAGYMGLLVWHGGLSGSAPLTITTWASARTVLPAPFVDALTLRLGGEGIDLSRTLASPMNLFITGGLLVIIPLMFILLTPRQKEDMRPIEACTTTPPQSVEPAERPADQQEGAFPRWLECSAWASLFLAALIIVALARFAYLKGGLTTITLNEVNAAMLALGLILHGSARSYISAIEDGARGCAGIIIQFPLYAGIMAMMQASGLVQLIADAFLAIGTPRTLPLLSFLAGAIVNLFVPSGGGQWAIQGPIALTAGMDAGVDPANMVMSVAYGDQLTNMLQPFWALPLLAITGVKARDIVGYTAIVMIVAGAWMGLGLLLF